MSPDIRETLRDAARAPQNPVDPPTLRRRGRRRRAAQVAAGSTAVILAAVVGVGAVTNQATRPAPPVITDAGPTFTPSPAATPSSGTDQEVRRVTAQGLGVSVAVQVGEVGIDLYRPDGSVGQVRFAKPTPHPLWFADDSGGGLWWHEDAPDQSLGDIHHHSSVLATEGLVLRNDAESQEYQLVGAIGNAALAVRRTGTSAQDATEDLVEIATDGTVRELLTGTGGWESGIGAVAGQEALVMVHRSLTNWELRFMVDPGATPKTVLTNADEGEGTHVEGIATLPGDEFVALLTTPAGHPDVPSGELLFLDSNGTERSRVPVPTTLGTDAWVVPQSVTAADGMVMVNRYTEGPYIEPLVLEVATGDWSVFDQRGLSRLTTTPTSDPEPPSPACATEDADLRRAAPTGDGRLWLYWSCSGPDWFPDALYRADEFALGADSGASLSRAEAVKRHLTALFAGPSSEQAARGYSGLDQIETRVNSVRIDGDGHATIDISTENGHLGLYGTSAAGAMWRASLTSTVFQHPGIVSYSVELDDSCEAYSAQFEGEGCWRTTADAAAWNGQDP